MADDPTKWSEERRRVASFGRLEDDLLEASPWYLWGPYLSERAWGTVREDYSHDGSAWDYLPHEKARSRAYRWSEDGLAGFSDIGQRLCLALALWKRTQSAGPSGFGERPCVDRGSLNAAPQRPPSPGRFTGPPLRDTAPVVRLAEHRRPLKGRPPGRLETSRGGERAGLVSIWRVRSVQAEDGWNPAIGEPE